MNTKESLCPPRVLFEITIKIADCVEKTFLFCVVVWYCNNSYFFKIFLKIY